VNVDTVTAQLLYEIAGPRYLNPDVVARFDTVRVEQAGPDRVRVLGARGEPAPPDTKLCINYMGGYRNRVRFVLAGLDIEAKARWAERVLFAKLGGAQRFAEVDVRLLRSDRPDPRSNEEAFAELVVTVKDRDPARVGRAFSNAATEMTLASYPGFTLAEPPGEERSYAVFWPTLVPNEVVQQEVVLDGERWPVAPVRPGAHPAPEVCAGAPAGRPPAAGPAAATGPTAPQPLGRVAGARSGDKGGNANVGLWVRDDAAYAWLEGFLTVERFRELVPEARGLGVERYTYPRLRSLNFVVAGLLGAGVAASVRSDPQAKTLGEYIRAKVVPIPTTLLR
jgi:hypothetical protein